MNWATAAAGLGAVLIAFLAQWYLRARIRQMGCAAQATHDFQAAGVDLLARNIPEEAREQIVKLASVVGTGKLTRRRMRSMADGKLGTPQRRARVEARREVWANYSREARIAFTRTVFPAILADSYFAGFVGTILRRTLFYVRSSPAEIALAIDAMETRILILATVAISETKAPPRSGGGHLARA